MVIFPACDLTKLNPAAEVIDTTTRRRLMSLPAASDQLHIFVLDWTGCVPARLFPSSAVLTSLSVRSAHASGSADARAEEGNSGTCLGAPAANNRGSDATMTNRCVLMAMTPRA